MLWALGSTYRFSRLIRATYPNWTATDFGTRRDYCFFQFLGPSTVDERPLYLVTDYRNDRTHYIVRHNVDTNDETVLHTFNSAVSSTGNNQGGDRDDSTALDEQHKASSTIEDDPSSSGNKAWYTLILIRIITIFLSTFNGIKRMIPLQEMQT